MAEQNAKAHGPLQGTLFWHWYDIGLGPGKYGALCAACTPSSVLRRLLSLLALTYTHSRRAHHRLNLVPDQGARERDAGHLRLGAGGAVPSLMSERGPRTEAAAPRPHPGLFLVEQSYSRNRTVVRASQVSRERVPRRWSGAGLALAAHSLRTLAS